MGLFVSGIYIYPPKDVSLPLENACPALSHPIPSHSIPYYPFTLPPSMPTVLVVGASGNIGTSAVLAALHAKFNVLAVVRNQESAEKLFRNAGTREGITMIEADVMSEQGVRGVVDKVRKGELPAFQHVYAAGECSERLRPACLQRAVVLTRRCRVPSRWFVQGYPPPRPHPRGDAQAHPGQL